MARKRADSEILSDITYLEMVLVVLACCLWKERFCSLKINFNSDNMTVVQILNSKSDRVMSLVILIVEWSMKCSLHIKAVRLPGVKNKICDSVSRMLWENFHRLSTRSGFAADPDNRGVWDVFTF